VKKPSVKQIDIKTWLIAEQDRSRGIRSVYLRAGILLARLPVRSVKELGKEDLGALLEALKPATASWFPALFLNTSWVQAGFPALKSFLESSEIDRIRDEIIQDLERVRRRQLVLIKGVHITIAIGDRRNLGRQLRHYNPPLSADSVDEDIPARLKGDTGSIYFGDFRSHFLQSFFADLQQVGFDSVRRCPSCQGIFIRAGRKQYCSRRCQEGAKTSRYKQSPDHNERKAFMMWRTAFRKANKRFPSPKEVSVWLKDHRDKLTRLGRPVSTQAIDKLQ
jgi:hypothetical protein